MAGKRNKQRRRFALVDSDDESSSVSSCSTAVSDDLTTAPETEELISGLDKNLDDLYEKRGSTRENALSLLINGFENKLQHEFVENKCITLLNQCHNSIKRGGSAKEINLASRLIGYLAITAGRGDNSHEILEESIASLSQVLKKSGSDSLMISSVLECLAIITFVGGSNSEDTERSMQIIWPFINPKLGSNVVVAGKPNTVILSAAISAWTFLLTTMDELQISSKPWQESISYFSSLLDKDDRTVRIAAGEALAVIFEMGNLDKFAKGAEGFIHLQGLKGKVVNQVRNLSVEARGKGLAKKDLDCQRDMFGEFLEFLEEEDYSPHTSVKICADALSISSWCQLIQMNFLKHFLGNGFVKHMQENVLLHQVFGFAPKKRNLTGSELHFAGTEKRIYKSPNSALNKARTQSRNQKRMISQGRNTGHFAVSAGEEEA